METSNTVLDKILNTGLGVAQAVASAKQPKVIQQPAQQPVQTTTTLPNWVKPAAIGGGILLLALIVVSMFKRS